MTVWLVRAFDRVTLLVLAAAICTQIASPAAAAEPDIDVFLDQATIAKLPERTSTIVVGNPLIADVTLQAGGLMVITGKGYGATNIIALDRGGNVLSEKTVQVQSPQGRVVVVYRGVTRESYSCAPMCERRITLGDTPEYFDATLQQTGNRNMRASAGANGSVR